MQNTQDEISKQFIKVGTDILKSAKGYQKINPELLNIFEYTFKSYLDIVKYIQEGKNNINIMDLEKYVFSKIFNNVKFEKINLKNNNCSVNNGFNPNQDINGVDMDLLQSLKKNINNIREKKVSINEYVDKVKEEYKTKE